jgi:hypothetical protein
MQTLVGLLITFKTNLAERNFDNVTVMESALTYLNLNGIN